MIEKEKYHMEHYKIENIPILYMHRVKQENKSEKKNLIFLFHKLLMNKDSELPLAYSLAQAGYAVVIMDIWGHGERADSFDFNRKYEFNHLYNDLFMTANDIEKVCLYLESEYSEDINLTEISAIGVSIGANVAMMAGYLSKRINKVISILGSLEWKQSIIDNSYISFRYFAYDRKVIEYENVKKQVEEYNPLNKYAELEKLPKLFYINGKLDTVIPMNMAVSGYNKMKNIYELFCQDDDISFKAYANTGHQITNEIVRDVVAWLNEAINC